MARRVSERSHTAGRIAVKALRRMTLAGFTTARVPPLAAPPNSHGDAVPCTRSGKACPF